MKNKIFDENAAKEVKRDIIIMSFMANRGHIASALSMSDYLGVLFENYITPEKYKFVIGKPYGGQAYYANFVYREWIKKEYERYGKEENEWRYFIHKDHPLITYVDETIGNCISFANGIALSGKNVFINISDAAFQEGTIWESLLFTGSKKLKNVVMAIDHNNMQALDKIPNVLPMGSYKQKLEAFGWIVYECSGHDTEEIRNMLSSIFKNDQTAPVALIFDTVKGKGVSFMENNRDWHYKALDQEHYEMALKELV